MQLLRLKPPKFNYNSIEIKLTYTEKNFRL